MTIDNLDEYIKYRYHRSEECLEEAFINIHQPLTSL